MYYSANILESLWKGAQSLGSSSRPWFEIRHIPDGSEVKVPARNAGDPGSILGWEDTLEEDKATHSSILTWRIPWTEEPGGLQSMGLQRVRYD